MSGTRRNTKRSSILSHAILTSETGYPTREACGRFDGLDLGAASEAARARDLFIPRRPPSALSLDGLRQSAAGKLDARREARGTQARRNSKRPRTRREMIKF